MKRFSFCATLLLLLALCFSLILSSCDGFDPSSLLPGQGDGDENGTIQDVDPEEKADEPEGKTDDPEGKTDDPEGKTDDPEGKTDDPEGKTDDPEGKTDDPEGKTDDPEGKTDDPEGKTDDPQGKTDDPEGKIDNPEEKKTLSPLTVTMIDVGQGDSFLIHAPDGVVLIDTGDKSSSSRNSLKKTLDGLGIKKIDYLVMTHPDADHIGGVPVILENYAVSNVLMTNGTKTTQIYKQVISDLEKHTEINVLSAKAGLSFEMGDAKFRLLAPSKDKYGDSNAYSIVIRMDYGENSFLFCGDLPASSEKEVTSTYSAEDLDVDVIKVPHHGADDCTSSTLLKLTTPQYALISVGARNTYGHPGSHLLDRLIAAGATVYRSDLCGSVSIVSDGSKLTVTTEK